MAAVRDCGVALAADVVIIIGRFPSVEEREHMCADQMTCARPFESHRCAALCTLALMIIHVLYHVFHVGYVFLCVFINNTCVHEICTEVIRIFEISLMHFQSFLTVKCKIYRKASTQLLSHSKHVYMAVY